MALRAAQTGHLVLTTLHTNSAPESIVRLLDLGMDPFNFADALLGILAQRLAPDAQVTFNYASAPAALLTRALAISPPAMALWRMNSTSDARAALPLRSPGRGERVVQDTE